MRDFLGQADIKATGIYARTSVEIKRKALEKVSDSPVFEIPSWQKDENMMSWLKDFGSHRQ